jgi:hypothetical protein
MPRKSAADSRPGGRLSPRERRDGLRATLPAPLGSDSEDVEWALEAAGNLWKSGDDAEALKWLRRAASAAAERDADARAVELFKAAADIASELDTSKKHLPSSGERARVPALPPATTVSEAPLPRLAKRFEDSEEDTFVRPGTRLRRALLAIDPEYAERTDYAEEELAPPSSSPRHSLNRDPASSDTGEAPPDSASTQPELARRSSTSEQETARRMSAAPEVRTIPGALPTVRVAVLPIPEEHDVRLVFLGLGEEAPPGVAVALLVPQTEEDAQRLARIYAESNSKL